MICNNPRVDLLWARRFPSNGPTTTSLQMKPTNTCPAATASQNRASFIRCNTQTRPVDNDLYLSVKAGAGYARVCVRQTVHLDHSGHGVGCIPVDLAVKPSPGKVTPGE